MACSSETVLAEKLETIFHVGKQIHDCVISMTCISYREDFIVTPDALRHALLATCRKRGHEELPQKESQFEMHLL